MKKAKRNDRRASQQTYLKQALLKQKEQQMKDFEKSKMLLTVLKKIESSIYEKKEHGLEDMSKLLHEQNELMQRIKQKKAKKKEDGIEQKESKKGLPSVYVLEELDISKKQAYEQLQRQNEQISERIRKLENSLARFQINPQSLQNQERHMYKLRQKNQRLHKYYACMCKQMEGYMRQDEERIACIRQQINEQVQGRDNYRINRLVQLLYKQLQQ